YNYQDIDGYYLGTNAFVFDDARALTKSREHCWYTNAALIQQGIDKIGTLPTTGTLTPLFNFSTAATVVPSGGAATAISFRFSNYADAAFAYDGANGTYLESQFGVPHTDANDGAQLAFTNVLVLATDITLKKDGVVSEFAMEGGNGWYFSQGAYAPITWKKGAPDQPLQLLDAAGKALAVNPGKSYVAMIGNDVKSTLTVDGAPLSA
ncbi:MAG: DUF3048 C-terminal domain-containing protein, partial [Pygmaiobacter sp.]